MSKQVDIWWVKDGELLKASLRWTNKKGRISFFLAPVKSGKVSCKKCPFKDNLICRDDHYNFLCSRLWAMDGDNNFKNRFLVTAWQPLGPLGREKKKKDKF